MIVLHLTCRRSLFDFVCPKCRRADRPIRLAARWLTGPRSLSEAAVLWDLSW